MTDPDVRYEVEWCYEIPMKDDECDVDAAKMRRVYVSDFGDAIAIAKSKLKEDQFGSVIVTEQCREYPELVGWYQWEETRSLHVEEEGQEYSIEDLLD